MFKQVCGEEFNVAKRTISATKLSDNDTVEEVYLLNKNGETVITYNDKAISLNKLKLGITVLTFL